MRVLLAFLFSLTIPLLTFSQTDQEIDLGGESVTTSIIPLRQDTTQAFRFDWLDLAFRDLVVEHSNEMSGSSFALLEFMPYEMLEAHEFLTDKAAFYRYFMNRVYQVPRRETSTEDNLERPERRREREPHYPIVRDMIKSGTTRSSTTQLNRRFVQPVRLKYSEADRSYFDRALLTTRLSDLYKMAMTQPNPRELRTDTEYRFKHERYFQDGVMELRSMAYDIYMQLNEELLTMSDDAIIDTGVDNNEQNRCVMVSRGRGERPVYICEKELRIFGSRLQQQLLHDTVITILQNTSSRLAEHFEEPVRKMESVAVKYRSQYVDMNTKERQLFDWIMAKTQVFCLNYRAVQNELKDYLQRPQDQTSYWHLMTFAEYLRVLEDITLDRSGKRDALMLYKELRESYHAEVWELEARFLDLQAGN